MMKCPTIVYKYCNTANFRVDLIGKVYVKFLLQISVGRLGKMSSGLKTHLYLL